MNEEFPYEDIVNLPHPVSRRHPQMPMENRAAQFAPFAALTGHDSAIAETARTTDSDIELSAEQLQELSRRLNYVMSLSECPVIEITYFRPDAHKAGGSYLTIRGSIRKVEVAYGIITLTDGTEIPIHAVIDIKGDLFSDL